MNTPNKAHKWAEVIKAWADGQSVQFRFETSSVWQDIPTVVSPLFNSYRGEWRYPTLAEIAKKAFLKDTERGFNACKTSEIRWQECVDAIQQALKTGEHS